MTCRKAQFFLVLLLSIATNGACTRNPPQYTLEGLYLNYPATDYEDVVIECSSGNIWIISANAILADIQKLYQSEDKSEYGELYFEIRGVFHAFERDLFPNAHQSGEFTGEEVLRVSSSMKDIEGCREKHLERP